MNFPSKSPYNLSLPYRRRQITASLDYRDRKSAVCVKQKQQLILPPDDPAVGGCDTCTKCIDASPTGAIVRPYELDANRCISYPTIELKGSIPAELAANVGNRIFGCDICQEVCPFNRRSTPTEEPAVQARASYGLAELAEMSEEEFRVALKGSAVKRAKWRGIIRNGVAALSASTEPQMKAKNRWLPGADGSALD